LLADQFLQAANYTAVGTTPGLWRSTVHSSYYAVFHAICEAGEHMLFADAVAAQLARRNVAHRTVVARCQHYSDAAVNKPDWKSERWSGPQQLTLPSIDLVRTAGHVVALQSLRIDADYNAEVGITKGDAQIASKKARTSIETIRRLQASQDDALLEVLRSIYFPTKRRD